jgi:N-acetyl-anhydromuramyl-L-alanine amidase AmpD
MWTWIKRLFGKLSGVTPAPASPNLPSGATMSFTVEQPLTSYDERRVFTPNKGNQAIKPEAVVLHHSDGSYRGGVEWIASPASKVSYHVLIARDGRRTVFCQDTERAWHAGKEQLVRPARP